MVGAFDHLKWTYDIGIWTAFRPGEGGFEQEFFQNYNAWGVVRGGDVEASKL